MNTRVLRRFIILMVVLIVVTVLGSDILRRYVERPPGDLETETGNLRLEDGLYDKALEEFNAALAVSPDHRGALMGRALVFIQTEDYDAAISELDYLIDFLQENLEADDKTGRGALAAAYANRGIVKDRLGQYQAALDDYVESLRTDSEAVEGPGVIDKILYDSDDFSTVRERAQYIYEQLQLPESERLMRVPEIDAKQRMHKP
jgi:tetratricopeptide (TPR) repeat protein